MEPFRGGFKGENNKHYRPNYPPGKGKQPMNWRDQPLCERCRKRHDGACEVTRIQCYGCGEMGHKINKCPRVAWNQSGVPPPTNQSRPPTFAPRGRPPAPRVGQWTGNDKKSQVGGRVYCLEAEREESGDPHAVVSGMFTVNTLPIKVLFDAGATHSFINPAVAK